MSAPKPKTELQLKREELKLILAGNEGAVAKQMARVANAVMNSAKRKCPVDRGKLRASITWEMRRENDQPVFVVGTNLEYAVYVHEGTGLWSKTKPGPIRPKNKPFLAWPKINKNYRQTGGPRRYKNGKTAAYVYAKQSAGSPGKPFLTDALKEVTGQS